MGRDMTFTVVKRKTFSGAGRPRKAGARQPNGQPKRSRTKERENATAVVLAQPHRASAKSGTEHDQRRVWKIGRLVLDGKVVSHRFGADELIFAAEKYAAAYADTQRVMASRVPYAVRAGGTGEDITPEQAFDIRQRMSKINRALADAGERIVKAAEEAILNDPAGDERVMAPWIILSLPVALEVLADHFGLPVKKVS